jgi:hypothetical protein
MTRSYDSSAGASPDEGTPILLLSGEASIIGSNINVGGTCTIVPALNALKPGTHNNLVTVYSGDMNFASITSGTLGTQTVSTKALTVTGTTVTPKPYDGTTAAAAGVLAVSNKASGDDLSLTGSVTRPPRMAGRRARVNHAADHRAEQIRLAHRRWFRDLIQCHRPNQRARGRQHAGRGDRNVQHEPELGCRHCRDIRNRTQPQGTAQSTVVSNGTTAEARYAPVLTVEGSTVTIHLAGTGYAAAAVVAEYRGVLTSNPVDQVAGATGAVTVTPKSLTVTGLTPGGKTYDGTTTVVLTGVAALAAIVAVGTGTTADG